MKTVIGASPGNAASRAQPIPELELGDRMREVGRARYRRRIAPVLPTA